MGPAAVTLAVVLAALVGVAGAASAQASDPMAAMAVLRPPVPTPAPDVVFRTLDGREARLEQFHGRAVLIGFFTTW